MLPDLRAALEAVLLVVEEPVDEVTLAQVLERPREEVAAMLRELAADYDADGPGLRAAQRSPAAGGSTPAPSCAPYVERFVRDGQSRQAQPGGAGDPRRRGLPAADDPVADRGGARRQRRCCDADTGHPRAGRRGRHGAGDPAPILYAHDRPLPRSARPGLAR